MIAVSITSATALPWHGKLSCAWRRRQAVSEAFVGALPPGSTENEWGGAAEPLPIGVDVRDQLGMDAAAGLHVGTTTRAGQLASKRLSGSDGGQKNEGDEELAHWMYSLEVSGSALLSAAASDPLALLRGD
jgi:hypothetical protein